MWSWVWLCVWCAGATLSIVYIMIVDIALCERPLFTSPFTTLFLRLRLPVYDPCITCRRSFWRRSVLRYLFYDVCIMLPVLRACFTSLFHESVLRRLYDDACIPIVNCLKNSSFFDRRTMFPNDVHVSCFTNDGDRPLEYVDSSFTNDVLRPMFYDQWFTSKKVVKQSETRVC